MRLKAILADDEPNILRNLQAVIPWAELEIDIVGTAKNGVEALELSSLHGPDLVMSDIRMPLMDGITFVQKLREINEACKVLMVTGYQDFEYARSLMRVGVSDYILKPINYEELENCIRKLANEIRENKAIKQQEQQKWGKMKNLAYEKILQDVLMNYTEVSAHTLLPIDNMDLETMTYSFMMIDVDDYSQKSLPWSEQERKLWNFAVRNVMQDSLGNFKAEFSVLQMREGEWCLLIQWDTCRVEDNEAQDDETRMQSNLYEVAMKLQKDVRESVKLGISVGFYTSAVGLRLLSDTYRKLQRFMQLNLNKQESVLLYKESKEQADANSSLWYLVEEIVTGLKQLNRIKTEDALNRLKLLLEGLPNSSFARAYQMLHFLILHVLRELREMNSLDAQEEEQVWRQLDKSESIQHLLQVMVQLASIGLEGTNKKKNSELLMTAAKEYIRTHYSNDFGVEDIASSLGISSSYFSLLFKQHFGETFVEYVTKHRMELAKSMLLHSDKSITDIGRSVGYMERRYFTKVFQKFTGEIPSEYREKRMEPK
ncbi:MULTISPECIES: response regulator transcription factor [Paenibacillus]|uniref:Response regulator n=1 Tax=Paenibacillus violae TaxID=3077234 RepID=A0ABU3RGN1_9BACL|nr:MULTISPECIES: response regulator [Paenibacillus]MDU0203407.1 response regulator [Paenibacillus sp. PFR10]MEC0266960.1 response regulator [Paenibacillus anseongense]